MFSVEQGDFILKGKKVFLNSGEIHYFRIDKKYWDKHLALAKEAGLTTVSTYVPWDWHEPEEGLFDFTGKTHPKRDLVGWIERCKSHGLMCILKPGPFILAEYRGAGLPDWFMERYVPEVKMHNSKGEPVASDGVSIFHPLYLKEVEAWYDQVMPLINYYQIDNGGPVILMQVCNEIGVFSWLAHQGDYNEIVRQKFIEYLKETNSSINYWNDLWGEKYKNFQSIELPPDGNNPYSSIGDRSRDYQWHLFWRRYYGDYLRLLSKMSRDRGVTLPFYHNLPGWIYGNGYEFPVNITMYEDLFQDKSDIIFGIDHIPEFVSYRNLHDDRIINDITHVMQGNKPLFAAEFQSGSREYHVVTNPLEMELFYKASIANGLKGWNYYMFSQGRNEPHKGYSGNTFYWFCPLTPEGEKTSAYSLVKRMSKIIKTSEEIIVNAKRKAEIAVLFYPPYYATELERPVDERSQITFNYSAIRRQAYFDGLLKILQVLNIDYDMIDLNSNEDIDVGAYKQIWAFTTDEMNADAQQKILDYTNQGDHTVIYPMLPVREMNGKPCRLLRNALNITKTGLDYIDSPLLDIIGHKDVKCANPQVTFNIDELTDAEIIATNLNQSICGFTKKVGKGSMTHLGTWLGFDTETHRDVYKSILKISGAKLQNASTDNEFLIVRERFTASDEALCLIANYYNEPLHGKVSYTHPENDEIIEIPYTEKSFSWPPLYAVLTPINLTLAKGIKLLHTTSDILAINPSTDGIKFILYGHRDLKGEMLLEYQDIDNIKEICLDEKSINFEIVEHRLIINYTHQQDKSSTLKIVFHETKK